MTPILDLLEEERIFYVTLEDENKLALFTEGCDSYFSYSLTKSQMLMLAEELQLLASRMVLLK